MVCMNFLSLVLFLLFFVSTHAKESGSLSQSFNSQREPLVTHLGELGGLKKETGRAFNYNFTYGSYINLLQEGKDEIQMGVIYLRTKFSHDISPSLQFLGDVKLQIKSGQIQQRYTQYHLKNTFYPYQFGLSYQPFKFLNLFAGSVNQKFLNSNLLIDQSWSFLGLKQAVSIYKNEFLNIKGVFQQTLPSYSIKNAYRNDKEKSASFLTAGLNMLTRWSLLNIESHITYYRFSSLPSYVAYESGLGGNHVLGNYPTVSSFAYPFHGYVVGSKGSFDFSNYLLLFDFYHVQNYGAAYHSADAQWASLGLKYFKRGFFTLEGKYSYFFNEGDVGPAYYNSPTYGNSNRLGSVFSLKVFLDKYKFNIAVKYIVAEPLKASTFQKNLNNFVLQTEVVNVQF